MSYINEIVIFISASIIVKAYFIMKGIEDDFHD